MTTDTAQRTDEGTGTSSRRWLLAAGFVVVVVVYAGLSRVWTDTESAWYRGLDEPPYQPPDAAFGIVWPLNYLALLVVGVLVSLQHPARAPRLLAVLAGSVVPALGWAYLFSQEHLLVPPAVSLAVAALITWLLLALAWRVRWWYGALLLVYACWMTLASALSIGFAVLN
ncbi:TspO/MBR family protein [Nocardioides caldifontis]|uniref:TspO/MBR family protein n=1 Tax=Nocardioides caldifontis TaxID=2588938 RepID=UPI0011DF9D65|nr:TspO/MBR family protein [Nocardioides caldifontis]